MTHDELDPHKTDQRDRRAVEDEDAAGGDAANPVQLRWGLNDVL